MTWVSWRLQRTETLIAAGILALVAALLVPTGITMASAYHHDGLAACLGANPSYSCTQAIVGFQLRFRPLFGLLDWFTLIPGLIGVLLAAPFVLELENGTYRLAWTQSVTRRRWIATKLAVPIAAALLIAAALILLTTWWRAPFVHLNGRMETGSYDSEGTVVFGYTLFALGLALAIGVDLAPGGGGRHPRVRRLLRRPHLRRHLAAKPPRHTPQSHLAHRRRATGEPRPRQHHQPDRKRPRRRRAARIRSARRHTSTLPSASGRPSCTPSTNRQATSGRCKDSRPRSSAASRSP